MNQNESEGKKSRATSLSNFRISNRPLSDPELQASPEVSESGSSSSCQGRSEMAASRLQIPSSLKNYKPTVSKEEKQNSNRSIEVNIRRASQLQMTAKSEVQRMQRLVFGQPVNTAAKLGVSGDATFTAICDWQLFEERVIREPSLQLPRFFLDQELPTNEWKNIPLPLIHAIQTLKRAHLNAENLVMEIFKQQKYRNENMVLKIKKMTDGQQEAFDKQRRYQEQRTKYQETLLE